MRSTRRGTIIGSAIGSSSAKTFQNFFCAPLVNICILGLETCHDYDRWPLKDRHAFDMLAGNHSLGQIFQQYMAADTLAEARSAELTGGKTSICTWRV